MDANLGLKQQVFGGLLRLAWGAKHLVGIPPDSAMETFWRLSRVVERQPRCRRARFRFPFGTVEYVDGPSVRWQYWEIFVQRVYDFQAERDDPVILDCGGNIGLSVVWFRERYPRSHITVFEADPMIAEVLSANLMALGLEGVQVVRAAAWTQVGEVPFARDGADSGRIDPCHGQHIVDAIRLTDFVTQPVDLLKLDVEGAEYAVIRDLCDTGKIAYVRRLICEVHGRSPDRDGLRSLLEALAEHGLWFTVAAARCAPDLPGAPELTPFPFARDGKFLLSLYAWQPNDMD